MMDKETLIRLANEAGIKGPAPARAGFKMYANPQRLMTFAALVVAAEREACAKACAELSSTASTGDEYMDGVVDCLAAIRARGEK